MCLFELVLRYSEMVKLLVGKLDKRVILFFGKNDIYLSMFKICFLKFSMYLKFRVVWVV